MTNSVSLIARYLDTDKQHELALSLSQDLEQKSENLVALCELLDVLGAETKDEVYPNIVRYCNCIMEDVEKHSESNYANILLLVGKLPQLYQYLLQKVFMCLRPFIRNSLDKFLPDIRKIISRSAEYGISPLKETTSSDEDKAPESDYILTLFHFLEYLFMNINDQVEDDADIDPILCYFVGISFDDIASVVSKLLRWRINSIISRFKHSSFVWDIIFALEKTNIKSHKSHAFIIWLRYLNNPMSHSVVGSDVFQKDIVTSEHYWRIIQAGLSSSSYEHRKFCLSILQLSVKSINTSFDNKIISWDVSSKDQHLHEWARYVTLYEILAIDTSLHQAEAGVNDIIGLVSPKSLIHPSWGFCLLSTGFTASMDSVRKFSLSLLLSIPLDNLYLIKHGLHFLEEVYLPYAMLAMHFSVNQVHGINEDTCEYGDRLRKFVTSLVTNLVDEQDIQDTTLSVIKVLENLKVAFDPARVYVSLGLIEGLRERQVLSFGKHDACLLKLFESNSEGELFERANQSINLRLLLNFKFTNLSAFIRVLEKFIKFNGYKLVHEYMDVILTYLRSNDISSELLINHLQGGNTQFFDEKVLIIGLAISLSSVIDSSLCKYIAREPVILLARLLYSNFNVENVFRSNEGAKLFEEFFSRALTSEKDLELYETLSEINLSSHKYLIPASINLVELWGMINIEVQSDDELTLKLVTKKLKFFSNIFAAIPLEGIENNELFAVGPLIKFNDLVFINSRNASKNSKDFYKVSDEVFGQYYRLLDLAIEKKTPTSKEVEDIVQIINPNHSHYNSCVALVGLSNSIVSNEYTTLVNIEKIVLILSEIWDNLNTSRLQLNQKALHVSIINTLYHPFILSASINNEPISEHLLEIGKSVIENSQGRRCLLPALAKCLSNYQIYNSSSFESIHWIPEILVRGFSLLQLRSNVFRLENVIGKLYDEYITSSENSQIYNEVYGSEEISARINIMAVLNSINSSDYGYKIFRFIIDNETEFNLFTVLKNTDGFEEWRRIQLFTIIISIIDRIESKVIISEYLSTFIGLIETDPSPLVRVYIEWVIAMNLLKSDDYSEKLFDKLKTLIDKTGLRPAIVTAYERILFLMIQQLSYAQESKALCKLLTIVVPGATSNKAMIRHFSVSLICSIYPEIKTKKLKVEPELVVMIENIYKSALNSESFGSYRSGDALLWDIEKDLNLVSISGALLLRLSDRDVDFITKEDYLEHLSQAQIDRLTHPIGENLQELWIRERKVNDKKSVKTVVNTSSSLSTQSPLQTKSGAWNNISDVDETANGSEIIRSDLIVVSSLVDKPPNLGGICRLCDVLGAGLLTLNDINVKYHSQFKSVAVTADNWMPMIELKSENIISFLKEKKREGYTLIGLEQTDKSVELNSDLKFPKKSLVLLGREKEGVPGDLLAELDFCVEIKQVGVIRSMNIQTATAIIVHAYSSQHC